MYQHALNLLTCAFNINTKLYPAPTMVDQATTMEEASDGTHGGESNEKKASPGNKAFKKKV